MPNSVAAQRFIHDKRAIRSSAIKRAYCLGVSPSVNSGPGVLFWGAAAAAALFAAHLAFIAAESCARRSGVIWRFFFTSLKEIRPLAPAGLGAVFAVRRR